jgi:hypothetical protein
MANPNILAVLQSRIGSADWSSWQFHRFIFYDYVRLPATGTNLLTFFANPLGSTDPTSGLAKTLEQTNIVKARSFGQQYFIVQQVRTHVHYLPKSRQGAAVQALTDELYDNVTNMAPDMINMLNNGVLLITIGQKEYIDIVMPFQQAPPGFGLDIKHHAASLSTAHPVEWIVQSSNLRDVWNVTPPQLVEPEQPIDVQISFPLVNSPTWAAITGTTKPNIDVGVLFDGYVARPAQ